MLLGVVLPLNITNVAVQGCDAVPLDGCEDAVYSSYIIACEGVGAAGGTTVYLEFEPAYAVELDNVAIVQVVYQLLGQFGKAGQDVGALKAALALYVFGYLGRAHRAAVNCFCGPLAVVCHLGAKGL